MNTFSSKLKELRKDNAAFQKDLAAILGVTIRQYQRYETGEQEPSIDGLLALADYFDVSLDYLVGRSDDPARH